VVRRAARRADYPSGLRPCPNAPARFEPRLTDTAVLVWTVEKDWPT